MIPARDALSRLRTGNERFVAEIRNQRALSETRRHEVVAKQEPFAIILDRKSTRLNSSHT